jgi:hypothetical protein
MSFEMTRRIADGIGRDDRNSRAAAALNFVRATLVADQAAGGSASQDLDVEKVFAAVELLADRRELEVAPFVSSWHAAVDALDQADVTAFSFDRDLSEVVLPNLKLPGLPPSGAYALISRLIDSRTGRGTAGATYRHLASLMLDELRTQVATTSKDVSYLEPLVRRGNLSSGLTIATLNYDRSIELAAEGFGVPIETGIDRWIAGRRWDLSLPQGIRLLKLHGSIDWVWKVVETAEGHLPRRIVVTSHEAGARPAVIFGQRGKLRAEGPFLSLLAEFESQLSGAGQLLVIGYSFRDDHVNEIIRRWEADDRARRITVVDPYWDSHSEDEDTDFRAQLEHHLIPWQQDSPGPALPLPFEPRLEVVRKTCAEALPELV